MHLRPSCLARLLLAALLLVVVGADPAGADPAGPTDFRSEITGATAPAGVLTVEVLGGDSFLLLEVTPGHEVVVLGYDDEPYLRFGADGVVEANRRSSSTYLNDDRYGEVELPADVDPEAAPEWERVATGGSYAWHDHRIHWMSPNTPPTVEEVGGEQKVTDWAVPLRVDGEAAEVQGRLLVEDSVSPVPFLGAAVVVAAGLWFGGRLRPVPAAAGAVLVGSVLALVVGWFDWTAVPTFLRISPLAVWLPAAGLVASVAALVFRRAPIPVIATLAAVASLGGWVLTRTAVLSSAVLPTELSPVVDRLGTAVVLGLAVGSAALAVGSGELLSGEPAPESG